MKTDSCEFDQWLKSHNISKNMMEKLERWLVPFPSSTPLALKTIDKLYATGIDRRGEFDGYLLQPVTTALYQYSYLLRWQSVGEVSIS